MEELAAELGGAFICAELGITVEARPDHARFLANRGNHLKADKRAIFARFQGRRGLGLPEGDSCLAAQIPDRQKTA